MLATRQIMVVLQNGKREQPAWTMACAWAAVTGARLHVYVPVTGGASEGEAQAWLASWLQGAAQACTHTVAAGKCLEGVLHEARRQEAELLLAGDGTLESKDLQGLMRQLPCPLYLVKRGLSPRRVAGAIGSAAEDTPHRLLNAVVLEHVLAMAQLWQAEARVLSALPNPAELVPLMGDAYAVGYAGEGLEVAYRQGLVEQASAFGLDDKAIITRVGRPDVVLPQLVDDEAIDCLLLGTVARQSLAAFWLGNTAEDVLPRVACDVLVLRPQDYFDPAA